MTRGFNIAMALTVGLLALFFLGLLASLGSQLASETAVRPPDASEIWFSVKLSILTATASAILSMIVAVPVAYVLSRYQFFAKDAVDTLLDLPLVLSPIALGALLLIFFHTAAGHQIEDIFGPFVFETRGIILAQFLVVVGLGIRLLKNTFDGIDPEFENLARTLGYDRARVFFKVVLPMSRKGLLAAFLLVWARAAGEFGATITLAGATSFKTDTVPVAIYLSFESADITRATIFISILIGLSLTVLFTVRKLGSHAR